MVFYPPRTAAVLPRIPDNIPICDFMLDERYGRHPLGYSSDPFTCGVSGKSYTAFEVVDRVDLLARALAKELGWQPNHGSEWDKVVCVFSVNTIDVLPLAWATHQLSGIVSPANAAYSAAELTHQLTSSKAKALFTCLPLLSTAVKAAINAGIPKNRIYLLDVPEQFSGDAKTPSDYMTVSTLLQEGQSFPKVEKLKWGPGQGSRTTAFLCYSSGTSGLPKGVMISHYNVIANTLQLTAFESKYRAGLKTRGSQSSFTDVVLGLLPQSHIYGLVAVCHAGPYRGDQTIVLPKFNLGQYLSAIQNFKIATLFLVPPIIITMLRNNELCNKYDLSAVRTIISGAAPLAAETATELQKQHPKWAIRQGYGLTETSSVVSWTAPNDIWHGSCGNLLPGVNARILSPDGKEITEYDTPGELVVRSPGVALGYLDSEEATKETFENGWMRAGDEAVIRLSSNNTEHLFIVDRIKELIKVKSFQVSPAELEAHILTHFAVADCAVIGVADEVAGELPKAFVVKSSAAGPDDVGTTRSITKYVEEHKSRHKWLKGGVDIIDVIPKSPSGKILRRLLRDKDRELNRQGGTKL